MRGRDRGQQPLGQFRSADGPGGVALQERETREERMLFVELGSLLEKT
jgi:hypothetical protein